MKDNVWKKRKKRGKKMVECSCLLLMFIFHENNQFHSEGLKWHVGYTLSAHALKEGWKTLTCNKIAKKKASVW